MYGREGRFGSLPPAERRLLESLREGRPEAFEQLVREYGPRIEAVARRMLRDPEGARDVAQEVYLAVVRNLDRFQARSRFGSWIHRIAVNRALIELRRRRRRPELALGDVTALEGATACLDLHSGPLPDPGEGPVEGLVRAELRRAVRRDVRALARPDRQVLTLRYLQEREPEEVARRLGLSSSAAKSRTHRARRRLLERWLRGSGAGP